MNAEPEWLITLIAPALTLDGRSTQVVVGLIRIEGAKGAEDTLRIAMRLGEDGEPVIIPIQATGEVIAHLRQIGIERVRRGGGV